MVFAGLGVTLAGFLLAFAASASRRPTAAGSA